MCRHAFLVLPLVFLAAVLLPSAADVPAALSLEPLTDADFLPRDPAKEDLGRLLFYDKILSGNTNISCATCHHALMATGDGLSLSVGEGGRGLGTTRDCGSGDGEIEERVPRNAPPVWNLGALQFTTMFHDGRVQPDGAFPSGFDSPAKGDLPEGLDNAVAVQAMFPVTSPAEMAGGSENPIGQAALISEVAVWDALAQRLRDPENGYVDRFVRAFSEIEEAADIEFVHAANAIAAFEAAAWRADDSPFDRVLRGDARAMSPMAVSGMGLFYGKAGCSSCHAGVLQTDHAFHAAGMPQIGPGKGDGIGLDDFGRERVTGDPADRYKFRTPSLRNVALNGPWGHAGAYADLEAAVRHMIDPVTALDAYDTAQARLPHHEVLSLQDFTLLDTTNWRRWVERQIEVTSVELSAGEVGAIVEFLHALTDPWSLELGDDVPGSVPSGLPVRD